MSHFMQSIFSNRHVYNNRFISKYGSPLLIWNFDVTSRMQFHSANFDSARQLAIFFQADVNIARDWCENDQPAT